MASKSGNHSEFESEDRDDNDDYYISLGLLMYFQVELRMVSAKQAFESKIKMTRRHAIIRSLLYNSYKKVPRGGKCCESYNHKRILLHNLKEKLEENT